MNVDLDTGFPAEGQAAPIACGPPLLDPLSVDAAEQTVAAFKKLTRLRWRGPILREVAAWADVKAESLFPGRRKFGPLCRARAIFHYLYRDISTKGWKPCGRDLGIDHTTALYSFRRVQRWMGEDPCLRAAVEEMRARIVASEGDGMAS